MDGLFLFTEFHPVRGVSRKGAKTIDHVIRPIKMGLKRVFQALKLVAGVGFEPTIPPRRDYEPDKMVAGVGFEPTTFRL